MRFISSQKHGLSWLKHDAVQEVDGETADITRVLGVEPKQQLSVIAWCVFTCCLYDNKSMNSFFSIQITYSQCTSCTAQGKVQLESDISRSYLLPRLFSQACSADLQILSSHSSSSCWSTSSVPERHGQGYSCCSAAHPRPHYLPEHGILGHLIKQIYIYFLKRQI